MHLPIVNMHSGVVASNKRDRFDIRVIADAIDGGGSSVNTVMSLMFKLRAIRLTH